MGLFFRPRRPLLRMATGAATAAVAYNAGKNRAEQDSYNRQAGAAYRTTRAAVPQQAAPPAAPQQAAPAAGQGTAGSGDPSAELSRLAKLHENGALTDAEFTAAKARLLGL